MFTDESPPPVNFSDLPAHNVALSYRSRFEGDHGVKVTLQGLLGDAGWFVGAGVTLQPRFEASFVSFPPAAAITLPDASKIHTAGTPLVAVYDTSGARQALALGYTPSYEIPDSAMALAAWGAPFSFFALSGGGLSGFADALGAAGLTVLSSTVIGSVFGAPIYTVVVQADRNDLGIWTPTNIGVSWAAPFSFGDGFAAQSAANPTIAGGSQYTLQFSMSKTRQLQIDLITGGTVRHTSFLGIGDDYIYPPRPGTAGAAPSLFYNPNYREGTAIPPPLTPEIQHMQDPVIAIANPYQFVLQDASEVCNLGIARLPVLGGTGYLATSPWIPDHESDAITSCAIAVGPGLLKRSLSWFNSSDASTICVALNGGAFNYRAYPFSSALGGLLLPCVENGAILRAKANGASVAWPAWIAVPIVPLPDSSTGTVDALIVGRLWDAYVVNDSSQLFATEEMEEPYALFRCVTSQPANSRASLYIAQEHD